MNELTKIIMENERLIYSIVKRFKTNQNEDDLFQVGCIGMIEAYKNYDETKNVKFTSYAYTYIMGAIYKYVNEDKTVRLSREIIKMQRKIEKAKIYLTQILMRIPTNKELAEYLEITEENLESIISYETDCLSLDIPVYDDVSLYDAIGNKTDYDTLIALKTELEKLKEPERTIMYSRYIKGMSQTKVAKEIGITQVDVSRKENKVLTKLKKTLWQ